MQIFHKWECYHISLIESYLSFIIFNLFIKTRLVHLILWVSSSCQNLIHSIQFLPLESNIWVELMIFGLTLRYLEGYILSLINEGLSALNLLFFADYVVYLIFEGPSVHLLLLQLVKKSIHAPTAVILLRVLLSTIHTRILKLLTVLEGLLLIEILLRAFWIVILRSLLHISSWNEAIVHKKLTLHLILRSTINRTLLFLALLRSLRKSLQHLLAKAVLQA